MDKPSPEKRPMRENYDSPLSSDVANTGADEQFFVKEKSPELKQAQVASFAAERLSHYEDARYVLDHISAIAGAEAADISRVTERPELVEDERGRFYETEQGAGRQVSKAQLYTDYLREVGGARHEAIARRDELLSAYRAFEPLLKNLRKDIGGYPSRAEHPNFLGSGKQADAFSLDTDGQEYVVRVPKGEAINALAVDNHLGGGVRAKGVPHLEQMVAVSYESGVTISERVPGQMITKVKAEELEHISDEQLNGLIDTIVRAGQAGLNVDPNPTNILYDVEQGFGIVDLSANEPVTAQEAADVASWFVIDICSAGTSGVEPTTPDNLKYLCAQYAAQILLIERYKAVCTERFTGDDSAKIGNDADQAIESLKVFKARYEKELGA